VNLGVLLIDRQLLSVEPLANNKNKEREFDIPFQAHFWMKNVTDIQNMDIVCHDGFVDAVVWIICLAF